MKEAIELFLEEINRKMKSTNTYITYKHCLSVYDKFASDNNYDWKLKDTAKKFIDFLVKKGLTGTSINLYVNALSSFCNFCIENDVLQKNIFKNLKVNTGKRLVHYLSNDDVDLLFQKLDKYNDYIELMLFGGLRISEAVKCKKENFFIEDGTVYCRIIGKGNKERITPILFDNAKKFLDFQPMKDITQGRIKEYLYRLSQSTGRHFTAHRLRHTFATRCLERGVPIEVIGEWLGHEDLKTTKVYAKVTMQKIKQYSVVRL